MAEISLRPARQGDAAALTTLIEKAYAPFLARGLSLPPVAEGIAEDIRDNVVVVAELGGCIVGGAVLVLYPEVAKLANLAVDPEASGKGLGRTLLSDAADRARAAGYGRLVLATHNDMAETIAFYHRLGWHETGREGDRVFMALDLRPPD